MALQQYGHQVGFCFGIGIAWLEIVVVSEWEQVSRSEGREVNHQMNRSEGRERSSRESGSG